MLFALHSSVNRLAIILTLSPIKIANIPLIFEQKVFAPMDVAAIPFKDPEVTLAGERRAEVGWRGFKTLWFNTGTLCNLTCAHCYIESSPSNDRLAYLSASEVAGYLDELASLGIADAEIGFTGG
jgi:sulfatase maturation enzyme AslB (radical SAM superfamily)